MSKRNEHFSIGEIVIICIFGIIMISMMGCSSAPQTQTEPDSFEDLRLEHQRLGREYDLFELRYAVRRVCRRVTAHEDWDDCDDRAGL